MKGYFTAQGFYGLVNGQYVLFSCDSDGCGWVECASE